MAAYTLMVFKDSRFNQRTDINTDYPSTKSDLQKLYTPNCEVFVYPRFNWVMGNCIDSFFGTQEDHSVYGAWVTSQVIGRILERMGLA